MVSDAYFRAELASTLSRLGWAASYDPLDPYHPVVVAPPRSDRVPRVEQERQYALFTHTWTGPTEWVVLALPRYGRIPRGGPKGYRSLGIPSEVRDAGRLIHALVDTLLAALDHWGPLPVDSDGPAEPAEAKPVPPPPQDPPPVPSPAVRGPKPRPAKREPNRLF